MYSRWECDELNTSMWYAWMASPTPNGCLSQLARSFVFGSARPIGEETGSALCTFRVPFDARLPLAGFNKLLTALPEVMLLSK